MFCRWHRKMSHKTEMKNVIPSAKHGGSIMLWHLFNAKGVAQLMQIKETNKTYI